MVEPSKIIVRLLHKEVRKNIIVWEEFTYVGYKKEDYKFIFNVSPIKSYHFCAQRDYPKEKKTKEIRYELFSKLFGKAGYNFINSMYNLLFSEKFWKNYSELGIKGIVPELNTLCSLEEDRLDLCDKKYLIEENGKLKEVSKEEQDKYSENNRKKLWKKQIEEMNKKAGFKK